MNTPSSVSSSRAPVNLLRLAEGRVLVEQIRLLLGNVGSTVIPTVVFSFILTFSLVNDSNREALWLWSLVIISAKLYAAYQARRLLARTIGEDEAPRLVLKLMLMRGLDGAIWGALAWITMDTATLAGSVLVLAFLAGIAGSALSLYSPVYPVFLSFVAGELLTIAAKLWSMGDSAYLALGAVAALYLFSLVTQGRNSAVATKAAILLRFENIDLIEKLKIETQKAQAADLAKSKFLAAVSHDMRQPLQAQSLFLSVLERGPLTPAQKAALDGANSATQSSTLVLNALLDFSRIEAGVIEPKDMTFPIHALIERIGGEMAPQAEAKGLTYRARRTSALVHSDPALVELILRNLISNAVRYTVRGGVLIGCRRRGGQVVVEVWDSGIGIDPSQQQEVFREFHQLGNPERDRSKGLGLGLAISHGLAQTLGLTLTLSSRVQRGSVFRLALPAGQRVEADREIMADPQPARLPEGGRRFPAPLRVLVIDDDAMVRAGLQALLREWGCECAVAESMGAALSLARMDPPELIISDYRLRESLTGPAVIAALRQQAGETIPALLVTGDTAPERLREAHASGIPLLHKPLPPERLYLEMCRVLGVEVVD